MINKIIDGISSAIYAAFGDGYEIYTESVEQGLTEPCFSIRCINPTIELFLGKRYFRGNQFCIHFFPASDDKNAECYATAEKLFEALELITVDDDLCRGTEVNYEISDDVLHFFVNYDMFVHRVTGDEALMEDLEMISDVRE